MTTLEAQESPAGTGLAPAGDARNATRTIAAPLRRALAVAPDATAVVCPLATESYRELGERVRRLVAALGGLGLRRGDRVAVLSVNCHRYLELHLALPIAGLVIVPLNTRHSDPERCYSISDSGTRVLFTDRAVAGVDELGVRVVDLVGEYDALLAATEPADLPDGEDAPGEHDLAGIFYTGGTTGAAKGVMLTHGNLVANAFHFMACWPFTEDTRFMVVAPMFHAAGTIGALATTWAAGTQVLVPAFTGAGVLDVVERERITATLVVPTMMDALAVEQAERPRDVSSLRWLSHGSSPAARELLRRTHATFPQASMLHIYGLTETAPIVTLHPDEQLRLDGPRAMSCGRPAVGVEVTILDVTERTPLGPGEVGEVAIRGANVTAGYWHKPEETAKVLRDGWFTSGDLGYLDEAGYLFLVDRAKDMIVSGGENVYSAEVENALYSHPAVVEAAVFGVPDDRFGEAVHAVVQTRTEVTGDELVAHCRLTIAGYKLPRGIDLQDGPLPKSGAGKILKRELRDAWWRGRDTRI
ncbi:class I adenylate-forming enzyme family protein [Actinomycetospora sp. TBRC 11914]|uniref:class I adenylate-forming enzyme family protein n=1 Tax=Actinomycetospora sp. TBRC 11914 TaxID=2729387 RepID=UPI00145DE1C3|nr:AMP-binding protein [Actinomycetospora sp. TBRC 11914]NMO92523.1 long-chain fatty acid--CoA ligase [Actinomycetospora sp. TBRC 11914]